MNGVKDFHLKLSFIIINLSLIYLAIPDTIRVGESLHIEVGQGNPIGKELPKQAKVSVIHPLLLLAIPQNTKLTVIAYLERI